VNNAALYILTVLVWGSTWIAIKFQLGDVSPLVSIGLIGGDGVRSRCIVSCAVRFG